jgi:IS5 family transposase
MANPAGMETSERYMAFFDPLIGRPSTPVECYLRLMFLKFRYRLG